MIKLIAIDIDGTLLNSQKELTETVKKTLQQAAAKGVKVVLCTGRPVKGVQKLLEELDIISSDQYVISYNGSLVQTTNGQETIAEFSLPFEDVVRLQQLADTLQVPYHAIDREAIYTTNKDIGDFTVHESQLVNMPIRYRTIEELAQNQFVAQKMMFVDYPEQLDAVIAQLPEWVNQDYFTVKSAPFYLEVLHKDANKGNAVKALCDHLNIPLTQAMAIGDNHNDLDMLAVVEHSVAMGNAVEAVKLAAKYTTASNDEDGVAKIVADLVLS